MTAARLTPHHPNTPQACAHNALRSLVYRIGVKETADLLGCHEDTPPRQLASGNINAFGWDDIIRLKKRERDEFGTTVLHDAEAHALYGDRPKVIQIDLGAVLHREISEDAGIIGRASKIVADGQVDAKDLPELEAMLPELQSHMEHLKELESGIRARIAALKNGGR